MPKLGGTHAPQFELEYVTHTIAALHAEGDGGYPVPLGQLPDELRLGTAGEKSKYAPYGMEDLTVGSWMRMGRALVECRGMQRRFRSFMTMSSR